MMAKVHEIGTETGYDALESAHATVIRLCARRRTLEEVAAAEGATDLAAVEKKLARLVRNGVLRKVDEFYESTAPVVYAKRQEGMVTFVSRFVLPNLMRLMRDGSGHAALLDLHIPLDAQRGLRPGMVADLARDLNAISDEPATEDKQVYTMVAMGTSDVPPAGEMEERLIEMVRRTSRQRLIPEVADRAFYTQFDTSLAPSAFDRAVARVQQAQQDLKAGFSGPERPNYLVALGISKRWDDGEVK